ncbi:MAG: multiheme c-type cytochrome [Planctomycetota bacterium]
MLTVFLTGNELGTLKPCGCSGGQLGGLDRRLAVFNSVPTSKRLIIDTGSFVEGDSEQDLIKFNIIIQAFNLLGYDLVNLSKKDIEISEGLGLLDSIGSVLNVISPLNSADVKVPSKFIKQLSLKEKTLPVTVAAFDAKSAPIEQARKLFASPSTANILILNHCDTAIIGSIARMGIVDCLVCPAESDEPEIISDPNQRPLVISVGRYGKYVGKLEVSFTETSNKKFSFSAVPVTEDLSQESSLVELYKTYQQLVKEENLLEIQPRFTLPNGLEYVGSKSCKLCHEYEYEKWSNKAHAHAYATLERVGSQYDPECVVCHVVGMEYESGFVSEGKTGNLKNVGCENCHGPGSEHIITLGVTETTEPKSDCTDCHTTDQSADYAGNEQLYFEKIIHWREPNAAGDVKK